MNIDTFIEEIATVFGWSETNYDKDTLLQFYKAYVRDDLNMASGISFIINARSAATQILKEFVRLYVNAEKYINSNEPFTIISHEGNGNGPYADFKTLAIDFNHKRKVIPNENELANYVTLSMFWLQVVPTSTIEI